MDNGKKIVFVIGVARSGTTAMADLLNRHPEVCLGIERYKFQFERRGQFKGNEFTAKRFFDFRTADTNVLPTLPRWKKVYDRLQQKYPHAKVVGDKIPHLFERFDECSRVYPDAKWIYMLREIDGVASSWNTRALNPEDNNWPSKNNFRAAVNIWNRANAQIRNLPEDQVRVVAYEDFFSGDKAARDALLDFIGVEDHPGFRRTAAATCRKYTDIVQTKPPRVLEGQEAHLAAEADMEIYADLLARARKAAAPELKNPTAGGADIKVLLLGLGKSGTTALMTGVSEALRIPFLMEPKNLMRIDYSSPVVVKKLIDDFSPREEVCLDRFDKIILIVRDPRDALISRLLYRPYGLPAFRRDRAVRLYTRRIAKKIARPASVSVTEILELLQSMSRDRTLEHLKALHSTSIRLYEAHADRIFLCHYEDFVAGENGELETWLDARLPKKIEIDGEYRRVARGGEVGAWKNWFTAEDTAFFDDMFANFYTAFGYRPEMPHAKQRIERANTVDYTIGLVNEWRARRGLLPFDPASSPLRDLVQEKPGVRAKEPAAGQRSIYRALRARLAALVNG